MTNATIEELQESLKKTSDFLGRQQLLKQLWKLGGQGRTEMGLDKACCERPHDANQQSATRSEESVVA